MIWESWYWKRELVDLLGDMKTWSARLSQDDLWDEEANFRLERSMFYSALVVRRLIESGKVTNRLEGSSFRMTTFDCRIRGPQKLAHHRGSYDLSEYDMENPKGADFSPRSLASEIMHSFTLVYYGNGGCSAVGGIYIASERNNYKRIIKLPLCFWEAVLEDFINDQISSLRVWWDESQQCIVSIRS